jgi:hypothetical protein
MTAAIPIRFPARSGRLRILCEEAPPGRNEVAPRSSRRLPRRNGPSLRRGRTPTDRLHHDGQIMENSAASADPSPSRRPRLSGSRGRRRGLCRLRRPPGSPEPRPCPRRRCRTVDEAAVLRLELRLPDRGPGRALEAGQCRFLSLLPGDLRESGEITLCGALLRMEAGLPGGPHRGARDKKEGHRTNETS